MEIPTSFLLGMVNALVVCGNCCVLYMLISQPTLRTPTNFLVLSLTISDLLLGAAILPFAIIQEHNSGWIFGEVACRLWLALDVWFSTASIYNLLAISFDRYMAVRQPIKYPIISSARVTRLMLLLVWAISLIPAVVLYVLDSSSGPRTRECQPIEMPSVYILLSALASFILPALIMIVLNLLIFRTVLTMSRSKCVTIRNGTSMRVHRGKRPSLIKISCDDSPTMKNSTSAAIDREKFRQTYTPSIHYSSLSLDKEPFDDTKDELPTLKSLMNHVVVVSMISTNKKRNNIMHHINGERARLSRFTRLSQRTELRVARTTSIVVAAFVICWFPFTTIYALQAYSLCTVPECISNAVYLVAFWLGYSNSAVNPLLYALFSRDVRAAFSKMFRTRKALK